MFSPPPPVRLERLGNTTPVPQAPGVNFMASQHFNTVLKHNAQNLMGTIDSMNNTSIGCLDETSFRWNIQRAKEDIQQNFYKKKMIFKPPAPPSTTFDRDSDASYQTLGDNDHAWGNQTRDELSRSSVGTIKGKKLIRKGTIEHHEQRIESRIPLEHQREKFLENARMKMMSSIDMHPDKLDVHMKQSFAGIMKAHPYDGIRLEKLTVNMPKLMTVGPQSIRWGHMMCNPKNVASTGQSDVSSHVLQAPHMHFNVAGITA